MPKGNEKEKINAYQKVMEMRRLMHENLTYIIKTSIFKTLHN